MANDTKPNQQPTKSESTKPVLVTYVLTERYYGDRLYEPGEKVSIWSDEKPGKTWRKLADVEVETKEKAAAAVPNVSARRVSDKEI